VAAFPSQNPLHPQPFGLTVYLGVQPLGQFGGMEETEISAFRGISTPSIVESNLVKKKEIT
jgi:hypothetical protein